MDDEQKKAKKKLEEKYEVQKEWSDRLQQAKDIEPMVNRAIQITEWQLQSFNTLPEDASGCITPGLFQSFSDDTDFWKNRLPSLPSHDFSSLASGTSVSMSAGSALYQTMDQASRSIEPEVNQWSIEGMGKYEAIQRQQKRIDDVRQGLNRLNPRLAQEFGEAVDKHHANLQLLKDKNGIATGFRNVLEHFKGDLVAKALEPPREQKIKWPIMAQRLSKGDSVDSHETRILIREEEKWRRLHTCLTDVLKNRPRGASIDLKTVFTELIDHLYTVLNLVRL